MCLVQETEDKNPYLCCYGYNNIYQKQFNHFKTWIYSSGKETSKFKSNL